MALVPCRECGAEISTEATSCPRCGVPSPASRPAVEAEAVEAPADSEVAEPAPAAALPPPKKKMSKVGCALWIIGTPLALFVVLALLVGGEKPRAPTAEPASAPKAETPQAAPVEPPAVQTATALPEAPLTPEPRVAPILDSATAPITKSGSPRTFKTWGAKGVARINKAYIGAAEIASRSSRCDAVSVTGLSFEKSKPPNDIIVFADCKNGERFYVTEAEAAAGSAVASEREGNEAIGESTALFACRDAVKQQLKYPSTMDASLLMGSSTGRAMNGAVQVYFTFEAKNDLGAMLPHEAYCTVDMNGLRIESIKTR